MKKNLLILCILLFLLPSCGNFNKKETQAPVIYVKKSEATCSLTEFKKLTDENTANEAAFLSNMDCIEKNINEAFEKIEGSKKGELHIEELKLLYEQKFFTGIEIHSTDWSLIKLLMRFLNDGGVPVIKEEKLKRVTTWLRRAAPYLTLLCKNSFEFREKYQIDPFLDASAIAFYGEFIDLISGKLDLSNADIKEVLTDFAVSKRLNKPLDLVVLLNQVDALWIVKALLFADEKSVAGIPGNLSGMAIKQAFRTVLHILENTPVTKEWLLVDAYPQHLSSNIINEWKWVADVATQYLDKNSFATIDSTLLGFAIKQLDSGSEMYLLSPDLVLLSQKLTQSLNFVKPGLIASALIPLIEQLPLMAEDLVTMAPQFGACSEISTDQNCKLPVRKWLQDPDLSLLALNGPLDYSNSFFNSDAGPNVRRLDFPLSWADATERVISRRLMQPIFRALAPQGKLPLTAIYQEDLSATVDLAYSFLKFAAIGNKTGEKDASRFERTTNIINIRPSSMYKLMATVGEGLNFNGKRDGFIDSEEFISMAHFYLTVQQVSKMSTWNLLMPWTKPGEEHYFYPRFEFINFFPKPFHATLPFSAKALSSMTLEKRRSLLHALVGYSKKKPIHVHRSWSGAGGVGVDLSDYVELSDILPPTALLFTLDRLMIRCDGDENSKINWKELDCFAPFIVEAVHGVLDSGVLSIDPGPYDISRFILEKIQRTGITAMLVKLLLINGTFSKLNLETQVFKNWAEETLSLSFEDVARAIGAFSVGTVIPESGKKLWVLESKKRYADCDLNKDGHIHGAVEMRAFIEKLNRTLIDFFVDGVLGAQAQKQKDLFNNYFEAFKNNEMMSLAGLLFAVPEKQLDDFFSKAGYSTDEKKVLELIEEIIHRSPENALIEEYFGGDPK